MEWIPEIHLWCNSANLLVVSMVANPIPHIFVVGDAGAI